MCEIIGEEKSLKIKIKIKIKIYLIRRKGWTKCYSKLGNGIAKNLRRQIEIANDVVQ